MYASIHRNHVETGPLFRQAAAASAAALFVGWLAMLALEVGRSGHWIPNIYSYTQALVLAGVFASYVIGWRHELVGGVLAIVGTAVFFAVGYQSVGAFPPLAAVLFAAPGMLYLLAWAGGDRKHITQKFV